MSTFPNWTLSGNLDWIVSPKLFFGIRGGYYLSDQYDTNVTEVPRYNWPTTNNIGLLDVPASLQRGTNFSNVLSNTKVVQDKLTRLYFQADSTFYGNLAGAHQLKFGVQADRLGNAVDSGEARPRVTIRWNARLSTNPAACNGIVTPTSTCRGTYGYYSVRSQEVDPTRGFITFGDVNMNVFGLFVQDQWTINNKLTINAGVRTEQEQVPYYAPGENVDGVVLPETGIEFGFGQKIAPRVGFAYDVKGDGRTKVFGSWGIFYDIFKLELPRGSFGGDKWLEYYYTLDTFDWPNSSTRQLPAGVPGAGDAGHRLPPHLGGVERDRAGSQADEAAGSDGRRRASAQRRRCRRASATCTSRLTAPSRTRRPRPSTRAAPRSTSSPTRARASPSRRSAPPTARSSRRCRSRSATTTASSSRSRSASRTAGTAQQLPVEPSVRQLLRAVAVGRKRPHQPERRPSLRLPDDDVHGRR